jgi:cytochrome P450
MTSPDIRTQRPSSAFLGLDALAAIKKDSLGYYRQMHATYGDAVPLRMGPYKFWFLFHPRHIEQVLAKQADKFIRFEKMMDILRQWNGNSLLIAEGASWHERRKKALPAFKQQRMPEYAKTIMDHARILLGEWRGEAEAKGAYECAIDDEMARYALDIAGLTLFGRRIGTQSAEICRAVHGLSQIAFRETTSIFPIPPFLPTSSNRYKKQVVALMKKTIGDIVASRLAEGTQDKNDLLSILIEHHRQDRQAIEEDTMSLLIAGHETSGATLAWLFLLLARHKDVLARIHAELDTAGEISFESLKQLPYLVAAVQESMRLYPAAYALFARRACEDVVLEGITIREGELVQLLPFITQRDGRWFKESDAFRPERFMGEATWPRYAYFPFGAGPRVCIGQSFGMMEVLATAVVLLKDLDMEAVDDTLDLIPRFSLRPSASHRIIVRPRHD